MKRKLEEQHKEHGRLKTEDKVRDILCKRWFLYSPSLQYHKERIANRDKNIVSTATTYSFPGDYKEGPFQQREINQFLRDFAQYRTEEKKKADTEKVKHFN